MKIAKLFKKVENFFRMDKQEQYENSKKRKKLRGSLKDKIASIKEKIKEAPSETKKEKMKQELEILKGFSEKLEKGQENKDE